MRRAVGRVPPDKRSIGSRRGALRSQDMLTLFYASALCGAAAMAAPFVLRLVAPRLARR